MKQYEEYKDSGIQWIGKIPKDWCLLPLKYYISFAKGRIPKDTTDENVGFPYLTMDYLRGRKDKQIIYTKDTENLPLMEDDDIIVLWDGANAGEFMRAKKGYLGSTMARVSFNQKKYDGSYFFYLLCSIETISKEFANGTTIPHFDSKILTDYSYPCPDITEQESIASYLDYKVGQIDSVISEKEKMLEDLKVYRSAIISEAVTKGLDKNVKMKDSGIERFPYINRHWRTIKLKYISTIKSGKLLANSELSKNGLYEVYGGNGFMGYTSEFNTESPAIVIGRVGALCGNVHLIDSSKWVTDNALVLNIIDDTISYEYLYFYLDAFDLNTLNSSNAQPLITGTKVLDVLMPLPSLDEQQRIVEKIKVKILVIDELINKFNEQISDLKSYKSSLITEAVTGKIDLRGWKK